MLVFARACSIRCYATSSSPFPPLPPVSEWRRLYDSSRKTVVLTNQDTATRLVDAFFPPQQESSGRRKIVIEGFAGPGVLTRALLQLPPSRMRKLVVMERNTKFFQHVQALEPFDPRVTALKLDAHNWESYDQVQEDVLDDIARPNWQDDTDLEFVGMLPHSVSGEQLMAQLLRAIPERSWLFKYGRMRMHIIMPGQLFDRINASLGKHKRCKLGVIAEATTRFHPALEPADLRPYDDHFWPPSYNPKIPVPDSRKPGHPMVAVTFEPLEQQVIQSGMLDKWDYCLRRLFVLKSAELEKALPSLAPGANNLVRYLRGPDVDPDAEVDIRLRVNSLTIKDWHNIVRAFDKWPFAPEMLYISNKFGSDRIL